MEAEEQVPVQHQQVDPLRPTEGQAGHLPQAVVAHVQEPQCQACRLIIREEFKEFGLSGTDNYQTQLRIQTKFTCKSR